MMRSLWTAATGMAAQQTNMDVIAHNLANANTTGFKRSRANFEDLMYQTITARAPRHPRIPRVPSGIELGMGAKTVSVQKIYGQGNFAQTGNQLDLAVEGRGFSGGAWERKKSIRGQERSNWTRKATSLIRRGAVCNPKSQSFPRRTAVITLNPAGPHSHRPGRKRCSPPRTLNLYDFSKSTGLLSAVATMQFLPKLPEKPRKTAGTQEYGALLQGFLENSNINGWRRWST